MLPIVLPSDFSVIRLARGSSRTLWPIAEWRILISAEAVAHRRGSSRMAVESFPPVLRGLERDRHSRNPEKSPTLQVSNSRRGEPETDSVRGG